MGAEEIHWGFSEINDLDLLHSKLNMSTKLNHKNGDKTMSEDLLIEKEDKIGKLKTLLTVMLHFDISSLGGICLPNLSICYKHQIKIQYNEADNISTSSTPIMYLAISIFFLSRLCWL